MHIERILLRDVGPFDDVTIELPKGTDPNLADVYLLTGPNGTGKSTILYALAAVIAGGKLDGHGALGSELLASRMRSPRSVVAFRADDAPTYATTWFLGADLSQRDPFGGPGLSSTGHSLQELGHWAPSSISPPDLRYSQKAALYRGGSSAAGDRPFEWAAFAYSGIRSMSDVRIAAMQEPKQSPFENSLSFVRTIDTSQLANWIASQNFRRLKAKEAGNTERAEQLARSVREIETVVAEVVGDPGFAFVVTDEDDDVHVRWKGKVIALGLLPDGLKSIVSWVADLLMRLDRIPWVDNTPVLQRKFLLLLDEVDIHLHPAWQRKVLPLVQRVFPNAQIIASTHSPFVVTSVDDARIITLGFRGSSSVVTSNTAPQIGVSYTAVLRSIFGIDSEFDIDTEKKLAAFHEARQRRLAGETAAEAELKQLADELSQRSEELREIIALELNQLQRQLRRHAAP
jgi:predicted ATP-binding protein involved in virulence